MLGRELDQRVLCMNGPEAAQTGEEAEDQVLGHEAPGEQTDDRSDLATDDCAHADADCAPEGCAALSDVRDGVEVIDVPADRNSRSHDSGRRDRRVAAMATREHRRQALTQWSEPSCIYAAL